MLISNRPSPVADRVGVDHESCCRLLGRPAAQAHQLEDLGTLLWGVVKTLLSGPILAMTPEDGQLALKKNRVRIGVITLCLNPGHG
ncbi:MAG: hypothetical protein RLN76_12155 [Phycisphaeraceae bacterium]